MDNIKQIQSIIEELFGINVDVNANFTESGLNSMDYIKLIVKIEQELNIEFDDSVLTQEINTLKDFSEVVATMKKESTLSSEI